jgi:hypothetical protein
MPLDPIDFARRCNSAGPCAQYVALWLKAQGVDGAPGRRAILRDWRRFGVEAGVALWCDRLGFRECAPGAYAIALAAQPDGAPLLGVIAENGLFVTRSFRRVRIARAPDILKAWTCRK